MAEAGFIKLKGHLTRFTDRPVMRSLDRTKLRFFNRVGGGVRTVAKRSLRRAAQLPLAQLTEKSRWWYEVELAAWRRGDRKTKPRRPEKTAQRGNPPLLHMRPKSPLRELLLYSVAEDEKSVVIGPAQFRSGRLDYLEANFPFMAPALAIMEPKFPQFLAQARQ